MTNETEAPILRGIHPSEFIQDELDARGWSLDDLAIRMTGDEAQKNRLALDIYALAGPENTNCRIGEEMAQSLSSAFGVSTEFFINLENSWLKANGIPLPKPSQERPET